MNINEIKNQISEMTYDELELKFELYSELESRDVFAEVMQELLAIELDRRESED
jgi:HSP20 family molecular chaperone IbpA